MEFSADYDVEVVRKQAFWEGDINVPGWGWESLGKDSQLGPGKSPDDVKVHYESLILDVSDIEFVPFARNPSEFSS